MTIGVLVDVAVDELAVALPDVPEDEPPTSLVTVGLDEAVAFPVSPGVGISVPDMILVVE